MTTRGRTIRLGIFILASAVLIAGLLVGFLGIEVAPGTRYYVVTDDAEGLDVSVPVKLRGVRVGRVTELELVSDGTPGVRVELQVDRGVRIQAGAKAYFELAGVSGLKMVNIRGGEANAPIVPPGSQLEVGETTLDKLSSQGDALLARASKVLENTDRLVSGLSRSAEKLDPERVEQTLQETQKAISELSRSAAQLNRMVTESRGPVRRSLSAAEGTLAQVDQAAQRSDQALENLNQTIVELRGVVRQNDGDLRATMDNLREATRSFKLLSQDLRRRPNRLLFGSTLPERELP
jgi:phospholipid/cholesterol/gamma-HCH transport system substrate-binding protein